MVDLWTGALIFTLFATAALLPAWPWSRFLGYIPSGLAALFLLIVLLAWIANGGI